MFIDIDEKPIVKFYINAGIYILNNKIIKLIPKNKVRNVEIKKFIALISEFLISTKRGKVIAIPKELINIPIKNKTILKLII